MGLQVIDFRQFIFGGRQNTLTEGDVYERICSYDLAPVTDQLYDFGKLLVAANRERTQQLERKAIAIIGYAGVFLALLLSREPVQSVVVGNWPPSLIRAASVFAGLAIVCTFGALLVKAHPWFSDRQWFENENDALGDADTIRRSHVLAMHSINKYMAASNDSKADFVMAAQACLIVAGLCGALWVVLR